MLPCRAGTFEVFQEKCRKYIIAKAPELLRAPEFVMRLFGCEFWDARQRVRIEANWMHARDVVLS